MRERRTTSAPVLRSRSAALLSALRCVGASIAVCPIAVALASILGASPALTAPADSGIPASEMVPSGAPTSSVRTIEAHPVSTGPVPSSAHGSPSSSLAAPADEASAFAAAARIFENKCLQCHSGAHPKMGLHLERDRAYRSMVNVPSRSSKHQYILIPGDPWSSALYLRLLPPSEGAYRGPRMPMKGSLTDAEIAAIRTWIESFPSSTWGAPASSGRDAASPAGVVLERPALFAPLFHDSFLADLPSSDTLGKQILAFRFSHRFKAGVRDAGADNVWGLDGGAWISLGLSYGVSDRIDIGIRRTNQLQNYEAYSKAALLRQIKNGSPVSLSVFGSVIRLDGSGLENRNRWSGQIILARRFAEWVSLEIAPTYVAHTNFLDENDTGGTLALGAAAEVRLNSFLALTGEWIGQRGVKAPRQAGSIGLSVRTSNHAFHLMFTNVQNTHTDLYAPGGDLGNHDFRLGFNISRTFEPMHP